MRLSSRHIIRPSLFRSQLQSNMKFYKMATMIGGVIERNNTIEENRQVLSELLGKNKFVEPSYKDLNKLFTRLNAHNAKDLVKDMQSHEPDWHGKKVTDRLYGPIPGIACGSWWGIRMDCSRDRMHDPFSASVQSGPVGAVSICTSHSNEDVDFGEILTFTGHSCGDEDKYFGKILGETEQYQGSSMSLVLNFKNQVPVRIIRSYDISNEYSPKTGYRYDGLYMVVHYWIGISPKSGLRCYKFALKRLFHQEPPPWKLKKPREDFESLTVSKQYSKNFSQGRTELVSTKFNPRINSNDTIISRCISSKRFQTRDRNMIGIVKSPRKRRPIRQKDTSLEIEAVQSTSKSQGAAITMLPVSPGRKIVSTDHRNVHVSAIVTRRVSKKLLKNSSMELKSPSESAVNKSWSFVGGTESQVIYNDAEDDGVKRSQNTRLQNTNISIRTDLYDSSHNLKYNPKKCGANAAHSTGVFKPRILGVPRRELNFAGVDSSPGSSRTISSVKMERVRSIDNQITKKNSDHLCQEKEKEKEKDKAVNLTSDILRIENTTRENETTKDLSEYPKSAPFENLESRYLHSFEHSYASESPKSLTPTRECTNLVSEVIKHKEYVQKEGDSSSGSSKDDGETDICTTEVPQNYATALKNSESFRTEEKSLEKCFLPVTSPSQSPFKGFQCSERSRGATESFLSESSVMMNSISFEKMLDIITENKSSPMARRLINNVIGFPTVESSAVFGEIIKTTQLDSRELDIPSTTQVSRENLWKRSRSRHSRPLENSREQKIIEIVYDGDEEDLSQGSADNCRSSFTSEGKSSAISSFSRKIEAQDKDLEVCLRLSNNQESVEDQRPPEKKMRLSRMEDAVDFWNDKSIGSVIGHCYVNENHEQTKTKGKEDLNSSRTQYSVPKTGELPISDIVSLSKPLASQDTNQTPRAQHSVAPGIITRSKCPRNLIHHSTNLETLGLAAADQNLGVNEDEDCNRNLKELQMGEKLVGNSTITLGLRSTRKVEQSENKGNNKVPKNVPSGLEDGNSSPNDTSSEENQKSKLENGDGRLSKDKSKSGEKIRLIKRSGGKIKRKLEVANLFIDMNMSPRSQKLKAKSRSRRSLRGANHSRRRSCPAAVDRAMKRRSEDPIKHPTSSLKRMKKRVQVEAKSSSVQGAAKKELSLRNRTKNGASTLRNDMIYKSNDRSDKKDPLKRIGKAKKAMNKIKKPIKTNNTRNLVAKKNTVNGLRTPVEISKKRENMMSTRSGINLRNLTVGRLGLRRALLPGIETYGRKKKKKREKQNQVQKQMVEKMQKQTSVSTKQSQPEKKELSQFTIKKAKLDSNLYEENKTRDTEKPKMVSVMTQCSLIPVLQSCSAVIIGSYSNKKNVESNLGSNTGYLRGSDSGSECICSSHNSPSEEIKNESIELIEIKSEVIDDDVANCDDGDDEEEIGGQSNANSVSNQAATRPKAPEVQSKSYTPYLKRFSRNFGTFGDQKNRDSVPRRGFLPYVAVRRVSAFVPVKPVESDLRIAQLKSIGFKPIKPGEFPQDSFKERTEYGRRSTSDSPRIAYSSGVVKRGVNEEYDKYTSEETNVVQYMDSRLCYEDIENEDIILYGGYTKRASSNDMFSQKMEFVKFGGRDIDEESSGNSFPRDRDNDQEEGIEKEEKEDEIEDFEDNDEYETEEIEEHDIKDWQSQLDDSRSSILENNEQTMADSDGDVPWHGWKKITSNKETYFVGW